MQKDTTYLTIPPAPKSIRGYTSSIDVSAEFILFFNASTVILQPHSQQHSVLSYVHLSDVAAVKFSPDGKLFASIDVKGSLHIVEVLPDRLILVKQYDNFFANAKSIDWSADKRRVCVVGQGKNQFGRVGLVESGTNAGQITGVTGQLNSCSFRPQRPYKLALGGDEMTLKFFEGPPYAFTKSDKSHGGYINQVKYSPKGSLILTGGADRKLTLHDGLKYDRISQKENAHNGGILGLDWIDQQHFVTCSSDKLIKIWNIKFEEKFIIQACSPQDMKNPKKFGLFLVAVRVFKDKIYAINIQGNILVYENPLLCNNEQKLIKTYSGSKSKISKLIAFSEKEVILLDFGGRILHYSIDKNRITAINPEIEIKCLLDGFILQKQNSKELFALLEDGSIAIYKSCSEQPLKFSKRIDKIAANYISGYNLNQFVGVTNNTVFIYDIEKEAIQKQATISEDITNLESNQNVIAVGTIKGKVHILNNDLQLVQKIDLATFKISTISYIQDNAPESTQILIGDSCGNMKLMRASSKGVEIMKENMGGHNSLITGASFDQKWIYTFSMDGKINLWNRETLMRDKEIKDIVKGGILTGVSIGKCIVVSGGDLLTKVIAKYY